MAEILYLSASEHKRRSLKEGLNTLGRKDVHFLNPPQYCEEPDLFSPATALLKTVMFLKHPDIKDELNELLLTMEALWVITMDVNGIVSDGEDSIILTSTRGQTTSILKVAETARAMKYLSKDGIGRINFDHLCGPVLVTQNGYESWQGYYERAELQLSHNLVRIMSDHTIWRKVVEASDRRPQTRPLDNPGATGGVDWSVLPLYLSTIASTLGMDGLEMIWTESDGQSWCANEGRREVGIVKRMTQHLRGFPERTLERIAQLT